MTDRNIELSRRKILGAAGAIGIAGAGAGMGTSALFSDEESFTNNSIEAGTLDLFIDYVTTVTQDGVSTGSTTNNGTIQGGVSGEYQIADAKPGDSGFLAFCPKIVDNPGWLFVGSAEGVTDYENGQTEPEGDVDGTGGGSLGSPNDGAGAGELSEAIQVDVEYCEVADGVTDPSGPDDYDKIREFNNPDDYTLADLFKEFESGFLLDGAPDTSGGNPSGTQEYPSSPDQNTQSGPCLCISWEIPVKIGNEIQSDAVEFDITFAARQWRNNPNPENPIADATVHPGDSIQSAINSASSEDVISVFGGDFGDDSDYSNIDIQKSLTLARASAERPKIVGGVFVDNTTGVVVDGFEVEREVAEAEGVFQLGAASGGPNNVAVADMTICNNIITAIPVGSATMGAVYAEDVDGLEVSNNLLTQYGGNSNPVRAFMQGRLSTEDLIYDGNTIETVFGIFLDGVDKGGFTYEVDATITNNEFVNNNQSVRADGPDAEADINNNLFNGTTGAYVVNDNGAQLPLSDILNNNNNTFTPNGTIDNNFLDGVIVPQ